MVSGAWSPGRYFSYLLGIGGESFHRSGVSIRKLGVAVGGAIRDDWPTTQRSLGRQGDCARRPHRRCGRPHHGLCEIGNRLEEIPPVEEVLRAIADDPVIRSLKGQLKTHVRAHFFLVESNPNDRSRFASLSFSHSPLYPASRYARALASWPATKNLPARVFSPHPHQHWPLLLLFLWIMG